MDMDHSLFVPILFDFRATGPFQPCSFSGYVQDLRDKKTPILMRMATDQLIPMGLAVS